ncbi:MAG TPA: hypothetical protein VGY30_01200 [Solirubrobacteraceae bacterium]|jgi:hypothetical protein|nr:hypothetical protein [Solirubrobacteraceae bacterium]
MSRHSLAGSYAKLNRAKRHVGSLRRAIRKKHGDTFSIPLSRQYEADKGAVVWRIQSLPEVSDIWGLLVGDALHNFRCALDHLWWQLASLHMGVEPSNKQAKDIQFPILSDPVFRDETRWMDHRFLQYIDPLHSAKVEPLQPFNPPEGDEINFLGVLADLSNEDKHRVIHAVFILPPGLGIPFPSNESFLDCEPVPVYMPEIGHAVKALKFRLGQGMTYVDSPILEVPVRVTGSNPDVDLEPDLPGRIAFSDRSQDVIDTLDGIARTVASVLALFDPIFL